MHNDFVIVGPYNDPAKIKGMKSATDSQKIMDSGSAFVSCMMIQALIKRKINLGKTQR